MTRVDLIIPTLDAADLLARCLDSLRHSTFTNFHLTVFDDGSTKPIAPVVHDRFPEARVIRADRNVGLAKAFNISIAESESEYVVLLNNDTVVEPDWLEELVASSAPLPANASVQDRADYFL